MMQSLLISLRRKPSALAGTWLIAILMLFAIGGPILVGHDPNLSDFAHGRTEIGTPTGPSASHWLGTDQLFRDVASRLCHGARISLTIGVLATLLNVAIGTAVGLVAGFAYGSGQQAARPDARMRLLALDAVLMRLVDAGLSFPYLLLVMAVGSALDLTSVASIVIILGTTGWLGTSRVVRAKTIQLWEVDFIVASRALGQRSPSILLRHVLPNVAGPIVVTASSSVANMILAESVLSYLTVGVQPPAATWGRMLREGQTYLTADPRLVAAPAICILAAVFAFNLLGEGLRDALDPKTA